MGRAKDAAIAHEEKLLEAADIARRAGVLQRCQFHEELFEDSGDLLSAYKLAANEYAKGGHQQFDSQRDLTDYVKLAVENWAADECPLCAKWRDQG